MTGTNCDLFTHNQSRSYLNHLVKRKVLQIPNNSVFDASSPRSSFPTIVTIYICDVYIKHDRRQNDYICN
jgi:hypothetical protein